METVELGTQYVMILAGDRLDVSVQSDGLRGDVTRDGVALAGAPAGTMAG